MKVTVKSKNLIPYPYYDTTKTANGITFTDNGDGSVTVNGEATATTNFLLLQTNLSVSLPKGKYTISGCPSGGGVNTYEIALAYASEENIQNKTLKYESGNSNCFEITEDKKYYMTIVIRDGAKLNNITFKPQLECGTSATEFRKNVSDITDVTLTLKNNISNESTLFEVDSDGSVSNAKSGQNIILSTDNDATVIYAEYNRDINKAFSELQALILDSKN